MIIHLKNEKGSPFGKPFQGICDTHNITGLPLVRKMMMYVHKLLHKNEPQK